MSNVNQSWPYKRLGTAQGRVHYICRWMRKVSITLYKKRLAERQHSVGLHNNLHTKQFQELLS